jgi:FHS family glucose/mannose:H+ symporter-like MFS transporter
MALYALYFGAIGVMLPFVGATFRLGPAVAGRLFPADFAGFIAGVLLCGTLSDRFGRKAVLLVSIAANGVGLVLFGAAPSFHLALAATALIGAGTGAMETVASAMASDLVPERRAFILNAIQIAFGIGAATGPTLAHWLMTHGTPWRTLYLALAAGSGLLFLFLAFQSVPHTRHDAEAVRFSALLELLKQPVFLALCLAQSLYVGAEVGFAWMPTYFTRVVPDGAARAGVVMTVFWIAMTIGRFATSALVQRIALLRLTLILAVAGAVGSAFTLLPLPPLAVACFVAWTGLAFSGIFGLILAEAGERYSTQTGTAFGGIVAAGGIGGAVVPWAIGALVDTSAGWRGALLLVPATMVALAGLTVWLQRSVER